MTKKNKPFHMGYFDENGEQYESVRTDVYAMDDRDVDHALDIGMETAKTFGAMLILSETRIKTF